MKKKISKKSTRKKEKVSKFRVIILIIVFICLVFLLTTGVRFLVNKLDLKTDKEIENISHAAFPLDVFSVPVITEIIDENHAGKTNEKRQIKYIVLHETDNFGSGAGAKSHANFLKENHDLKRSWHYTVDEKEIYHHLPDNEVGYHAGDRARSSEIKMELELKSVLIVMGIMKSQLKMLKN